MDIYPYLKNWLKVTVVVHLVPMETEIGETQLGQFIRKRVTFENTIHFRLNYICIWLPEYNVDS